MNSRLLQIPRRGGGEQQRGSGDDERGVDQRAQQQLHVPAEPRDTSRQLDKRALVYLIGGRGADVS